MNTSEEYINQIKIKLGYPVIDIQLDDKNIANVIEEEFDSLIGNRLRSQLTSEQVESVLNNKQFKNIVVGLLMQQNALNIIYGLMYEKDIANAQITIMAATQLIKYGKYLESKGRKNWNI